MIDVGRYLDPPTVEQLNRLRPAARRGVADGLAIGPHRGRSPGTGTAFRQHRPYVPGDEPRRIDWRALARTDRATVRELDAETNRRCLLLLDASGSMAYADKAAHAARVVAALAYLMLAAGEAVGVGVVGPGVRAWLPPRAGWPHLSRVLDLLDRGRPGGAADWPRAAGEVVARGGRRAAVVVVSDLLAPAAAVRGGLARLGRAGHGVTCVRTLHADETTFPFRGGLSLRGLEGEPTVACDPSVARSAYLARFDRHRRDLTAACGGLGVPVHPVTTADPVAGIVAGIVAGVLGR